MSSRRRWSPTATFAASAAETYSASVVDTDTFSCALLIQLSLTSLYTKRTN